MAGMGTFRSNNQYKQQDPMKNANALAYLLNSKAKGLDGMSEAIDSHGESMGRSAIADLMANNKFEGQTPEAIQSLIQEATGGRSIGEQGENTINQLLNSSRDRQGNTWNEEAAQKRTDDATALEGLKQSNRLALNKEKNKNSAPSISAEEYAQNLRDMYVQEQIMNNPDSSDGQKQIARDNYNMIKFKNTMSVSGNKLSADQKENLTSTEKLTGKTSKSKTKTRFGANFDSKLNTTDIKSINELDDAGFIKTKVIRDKDNKVIGDEIYYKGYKIPADKLSDKKYLKLVDDKIKENNQTKIIPKKEEKQNGIWELLGGFFN